MKRIFLFFLLIVVIFTSSRTIAQGDILYGIYDPEGIFTSDDRISIEMAYLAWEENTSKLESVLESTGDRFPLITLEPWPRYDDNLTEEMLFSDILIGLYDKTIINTCTVIGNHDTEVWLRWGHEMELLGLYPWSQGDPVGFSNAFRYFTVLCRTYAPNVRMIWSPAGDGSRLASGYWPGNEYVDYIGLTDLGYSEWDRLSGVTKPLTFSQVLTPRYNLIDGYNKPIIIAELGVCCGREHQSLWLADAYNHLSDFPLITAVVYFNSVNPANSWGLGLTPDWRVDQSQYPPNQ